MFNYISVIIVKIHKDTYVLRFKNGITSCSALHIRKTISLIHGVESSENGQAESYKIPEKYLAIVKMYLDIEDITFIFMDSLDYKLIMDAHNNHDITKMESYDEPDTFKHDVSFGGNFPLMHVVKVENKTGIIKMAKFDANLINFIKSLPKEHRKYDSETRTWTITDKPTLTTFLIEARKLPAIIIENV